MGSRSRKRIRTEAPKPVRDPAPSATPAQEPTPTPRAASEQEPARPTPRAITPEPEPAAGSMGAAYAARSVKTEAKNQAVRDTLVPLGPGERPPWVTYAAILGFGLGTLNIVLYLAGVRVEGATIGGTVLVGLILVACSVGMWMAKYSAVLAFEVLLGITAAFAALSLLVASSVTGALRSVVVVAVSGTFFWKLIRAMARMQMPARPGEQRR